MKNLKNNNLSKEITNKKGHKYCPVENKTANNQQKKHKNRKNKTKRQMNKYNICNNKNEFIKTQRLKLNQTMKRNKTKRNQGFKQ